MPGRGEAVQHKSFWSEKWHTPATLALINVHTIFGFAAPFSFRVKCLYKTDEKQTDPQ